MELIFTFLRTDTTDHCGLIRAIGNHMTLLTTETTITVEWTGDLCIGTFSLVVADLAAVEAFSGQLAGLRAFTRHMPGDPTA
jgi:hypothetical protein